MQRNKNPDIQLTTGGNTEFGPINSHQPVSETVQDHTKQRNELPHKGMPRMIHINATKHEQPNSNGVSS